MCLSLRLYLGVKPESCWAGCLNQGMCCMCQNKPILETVSNPEFKEKLKDKWPGKAKKVYGLYRGLDIRFCKSTDERLGNLRDEKDIPVLSDAIYHGIDVILSGDKDFLEAGLQKPLVYSPAMMLEYLQLR